MEEMPLVDMNEVSLEKLKHLMTFRKQEGKDAIELKFGGTEALCKKLKSDSQNGVANDEAELHQRRELYGNNKIPSPPIKSFICLVWEAFKSVTLIILLVSAIISIGLSFYTPPPDDDERDCDNATTIATASNGGSSHGAAILISVIVVVLVTAINDYTKERQFRGIFQGLICNPIFYCIWITTMILQIVIVTFGDVWFSTARLDILQWIWCTGFGLGTLAWGQIINFIPVECSLKK